MLIFAGFFSMAYGYIFTATTDKICHRIDETTAKRPFIDIIILRLIS